MLKTIKTLINTNLNPCPLLYLPRNLKENYIHNDRKNRDMTDEVIKQDGVIMDTYSINNFYIQLSIVNSAQRIILDYGSSYLVNCIFIDSKTIELLGASCMDSQYQFPSMKYLIDKITSKNSVTCI